jgi:hypothetical protein
MPESPDATLKAAWQTQWKNAWKDHFSSDQQPHPFWAHRSLRLSQSHVQAISAFIAAIDALRNNPLYVEQALQDAPQWLRALSEKGLLGKGVNGGNGVNGVLWAYDFHLSPQGQLGLIEINTNAGGAMLNAWMARVLGRSEAALWEAGLIDMFEQEWAAWLASSSTPIRPLQTIAIVDENPSQQALYAEFLLFQALFQRYGWYCVIVDPQDLTITQGRMCAKATPIDLIYNRLTDFDWRLPAQAVLRQASEQGLALITPHPLHYALLADKRRLIALSDSEQQKTWADPATQTLLQAHVLPTIPVNTSLWAERKKWFFKPAQGFGSKAVYRGRNLTHKTWEAILTQNYVAQALLEPGMCAPVEGSSDETRLKWDLRVYAYAGRVLGLAGRLYQGQTTNLHTPQGGFAPVDIVDVVDIVNNLDSLND